MRIIKILSLVLIWFATSFCFAQKLKVEYIIKNDSLPKKEKKNFIYLADETDITKARYIGRLKATNKMNSIDVAQMILKDKAQKMGGNSFKFVDFKNNDGISELTLDIYVVDENIILNNQNYLPKNKIYFFGKDNLKKETVEEYTLNDERKELRSLHYQVYDFDQPIKIKKGKMFGTTLNLKPNKDGNSIFINFSGFGMSANSTYNGGIGIGFSGGDIIIMDSDYGLLLSRIYTEE